MLCIRVAHCRIVATSGDQCRFQDRKHKMIVSPRYTLHQQQLEITWAIQWATHYSDTSLTTWATHCVTSVITWATHYVTSLITCEQHITDYLSNTLRHWLLSASQSFSEQSPTLEVVGRFFCHVSRLVGTMWRWAHARHPFVLSNKSSRLLVQWR